MEFAGHHRHWAAWLLVLMGSFGSPSPTSASASITAHVQINGAPTFLGTQGRRWLAKLLQTRGFSLCMKSKHICQHDLIRVELSPQGQLHISKGKTSRTFKVPSRYKQAQLKARAVVTFVSLFVEMTTPVRLSLPRFRPPPTPSAKQPTAARPAPKAPAPVARKKPTPRAVVRKKPTPRAAVRRPPARRKSPQVASPTAPTQTTRRRRKATKGAAPTQVAPTRPKAAERVAPKRAAPTAPNAARPTTPNAARPTAPTQVAPTRPVPAKRALPRRREPPVASVATPARPKPPKVPGNEIDPFAPTASRAAPRRQAPKGRRTNVAKASIPKRPQPRKRVASVGVSKRAAPLPRHRRGWLGLGVGAVAGVQGADLVGIPMGGGLSLAGGRDIWSLRLALFAQPMLGLPAPSQGFVGRADLLFGLVPLRGAFRLSLELGVSFELLQATIAEKVRWEYRFGGFAGVRLGWQVTPSVQLYARPAFLLFPQSYQFQYRNELMYTASIWRAELALGLEFRLW